MKEKTQFKSKWSESTYYNQKNMKWNNFKAKLSEPIYYTKKTWSEAT